MQNSYLDHPAEEALERFLLHQCPDEELDTVETHILGCGSCVSRLEALETQIADLRIAFEELQHEQTVAVAAKQHRSWKTWFTVPNLAWAGAGAAVVVGLALTPQFLRHPAPLADVSLLAYRGSEVTSVPEHRRLHVHLNAADLPEGPVVVELVNDTGVRVWQSATQIHGEAADVVAPQIDQPGAYFFRIYSAGQGNRPSELLREFALQVN